MKPLNASRYKIVIYYSHQTKNIRLHTGGLQNEILIKRHNLFVKRKLAYKAITSNQILTCVTD